MELKIVPTINCTGYWVSIAGFSVFNENSRLALESCSELIADRIVSLQKEIEKLEAQKLETDNELEKLGGKYRPRRVAVPKAELWFRKCSSCKKNNHEINSVAIETRIGRIKIFCHSCGSKKFPSLVE